jgi:hypothetical protein
MAFRWFYDYGAEYEAPLLPFYNAGWTKPAQQSCLTRNDSRRPEL